MSKAVVCIFAVLLTCPVPNILFADDMCSYWTDGILCFDNAYNISRLKENNFGITQLLYSVDGVSNSSLAEFYDDYYDNLCFTKIFDSGEQVLYVPGMQNVVLRKQRDKHWVSKDGYMLASLVIVWGENGGIGGKCRIICQVVPNIDIEQFGSFVDRIVLSGGMNSFENKVGKDAFGYKRLLTVDAESLLDKFPNDVDIEDYVEFVQVYRNRYDEVIKNNICFSH